MNSVKLQSLSAAASTLLLLVGSQFAVLSWFEHSKSLRPSIILNGYLCFTLLLGIVQSRTFLLDNTKSIIGRIFTASVCLQVLILILESVPKIRWLRSEDQTRAPEETTGPIGLSLYTWLNSLLLKGRTKVLVSDDLPEIPHALSVDNVGHELWLAFHESKLRSHFRLFFAIAKTLRWSLVKPVL